MIVSISGAPGSGKSTVAEKLAKKLGWPNYYIGEIRRKKAKSVGMTLAEYNKFAETNPKTDLDVDKYQAQLGKEKDNFIIQGRTSWFFIPHSLKIFVDVNKTVGAERVSKQLAGKNKRNEGNNLLTIKDIKKSHAERMACDKKRYKKYYGITNAFDKRHFNYVVDTTNLNPEQVFAKVYSFIKKKLKTKR
jgi:cytidylate kinase